MKNRLRKNERALVGEGFSLIRPVSEPPNPLVRFLIEPDDESLSPEAKEFFSQIVANMSEKELRYVLKLCERQLRVHYLCSKFDAPPKLAGELDKLDLARRGVAASNWPTLLCRMH